MLQLRKISPDDNAAAARVIRTVMPEFSCVGEGYSINDPEVDDMFSHYQGSGSAFYVLEDTDLEAKVVGVAGFALLTGSDGSVCELRKMYLLPEARGKGGGKLLLDKCLLEARSAGYARMYLETVSAMTTAAKIYRNYGFTEIDGPMGTTGHNACDRFMIKTLE